MSASLDTSVVLRLYVAGTAPNSLRALGNIRAICAERFPGAHELEVVDMLAEPARALKDGVIVTPTLLRMSPGPIQRLVGSLNDAANVIRVLEAQ